MHDGIRSIGLQKLGVKWTGLGKVRDREKESQGFVTFAWRILLQLRTEGELAFFFLRHVAKSELFANDLQNGRGKHFSTYSSSNILRQDSN